jgi:hypothetical protein
VFRKQTRYPVAFPRAGRYEAGFSSDISWANLVAVGDWWSQGVILAAADYYGFQQLQGDDVHFDSAGGFGPYGTRDAAIDTNQALASRGIQVCQ